MKAKTFTQKARAKLWLLSTVFLFGAKQASAQFPAPYCNVSFPSGVEPITLVNFAGINNTSSATPGGPALQDFTSIVGTVGQGITYPFTAQGNTVDESTNYFRVFIDWNQNNVFTDAGESYDIGSIYFSNGTDGIQTTNNITVPATALLGNTRMRVVKRFNSYGTSCITSSWGEAEDYTINVTVPPCAFPTATFTVVPNCNLNEYSVDVNISGMGNATSFNINSGSNTLATAPAPGVYTVGPFVSGTTNTLTLVHDVNTLCNLNSSPLVFHCPPTNDECGNATVLQVSPGITCATVDSGNTIGSTASADPVGGTCGSTSGNSFNDDVWFTFDATDASVVITETNISGAADLITAVYSGSCGALTQIACSDPQTFRVDGLTVGQTYHIRVASYATIATTTSKFKICLTTPIAPVNDLCVNATPLVASANNICAASTAGTTLYATTETQTLPTCSPTGVNDDVWYTFEAVNTTHIVQITSASSTTAAQVYSGGCGALTVVSGACGSGTAVAAGLVPGQTYYVRVYTTVATPATFSTFNICVISRPANDECVNAIVVTPSSTANCTASISGSTNIATQSTGATSCNSTGVNDDVWYQFTATTNSHRIILSNITGAVSDMAVGVYEGTCGALTQLACNDPETSDVHNLVIGNTYYLRIWTWSSTSTSNANFDLCIGEISCSYPTTPTSANPTTSSADLSWVQSSSPAEWEIEYGAGPFTFGTGTRMVVSSNPYTLTGLASGTQYSYFVRAVCAPGDSSQWTARATFTTACEPTYGVNYDQPFTTSAAIPACWTQARGYLNTTTTFTGTTTNWVSDNWMNVSGSTNRASRINLHTNTKRDWMISPTIDLPAGNDASLEFDLSITTFGGSAAVQLGSDDTVAVVISTDNGATWSIANTLMMWTAANTPIAGATQHVEISLAAYSGQIKIGFYGSEGTVDDAPDNDIMIDNFKIAEPLSIDLADVRATNIGQRNRIDWNTASEDAGDGFVLERSFDGKSFTQIGAVQGKGSAAAYSFIDEAPLSGVNHYRLKLTSLEGTPSYSKVVSATVAGRAGFTMEAFPNPVTDQLTMKLNGGQLAGTITVTDLSGKVIRQLQTTASVVTIDMRGLVAGVYIVKYMDGVNNHTMKISKQ